MPNYTDDKEFYVPTDLEGDDMVHDFFPGIAENFRKLDRNLYIFPKETIDHTGGSQVQEALQAFFDNEVPDNATVYLPPGDYWVEKNTGLTEYPNGDQPCLLLRNRKNLRILAHGARLFTRTHAQGILELELCQNILIEGLKVEGYGRFPAIDGTSGYGEKGDSTYGYDTKGFWGYRKNNQTDTSKNTTHGNGGAAWGLFGGGYIGNVSYGILIHRGCKNVTLAKCEAQGFNYVGLAVGHNGDYNPTNRGFGDSEDITFIDCYSHDNFEANFHAMAVSRFRLLNCVGERAGHPNAALTHTYVDPGYGFSARGSIYSPAKEVVVVNCTFRYNNRKGIDAHSVSGFQVTNNYVMGSYVCGIFARWSDPSQYAREIQIVGNKIEATGHHRHSEGAINVGGRRGADYSRATIETMAVIHANICKNCAGDPGIMEVGPFDIANVSDNVVRGVHNQAVPTSVYGINVGTAEISYSGIISGNIVDSNANTKMVRGIQVRALAEGNVIGNTVKLLHTAANIGLYLTECVNVNAQGNYAATNAGKAFELAQTQGAVGGNIARGGPEGNLQYGSWVIPTSPVDPTNPVTGALLQSNLGRMRLYHPSNVFAEYRAVIHFRILANGGAGTLYFYSGQDFVAGTASDPMGLAINLKNVPAGVTPAVMTQQAGRFGLRNSGNSTYNVGHIYNRAIGTSQVIIGLRTGAATGNDIPFANLNDGSLDVVILI